MADRHGPRVSVSLTREEEEALRAAAEEEGLPVAALARRGVVREIRALRSRLPPRPERSTQD